MELKAAAWPHQAILPQEDRWPVGWDGQVPSMPQPHLKSLVSF